MWWLYDIIIQNDSRCSPHGYIRMVVLYVCIACAFHSVLHVLFWWGRLSHLLRGKCQDNQLRDILTCTHPNPAKVHGLQVTSYRVSWSHSHSCCQIQSYNYSNVCGLHLLLFLISYACFSVYSTQNSMHSVYITTHCITYTTAFVTGLVTN